MIRRLHGLRRFPFGSRLSRQADATSCTRNRVFTPQAILGLERNLCNLRNLWILYLRALCVSVVKFKSLA